MTPIYQRQMWKDVGWLIALWAIRITAGLIAAAVLT